MAVYACSDIHGYYNLYEAICKRLKPEDKVIFLGDAGDRGPESLRTIKAILNNPQWIYLKGNHEDMLVDAIRHGPNSEASYLCIHNGGRGTLTAVREDPDMANIIKQLDDLPVYYFYHSEKMNLNYHCTHAGFTPNRNTTNVFEFRSTYDLIWDRRHIEGDGFGYEYYIPEAYFNSIILHGHTPVENMTEYYDIPGRWLGEPLHSPYQYSQDNKVNIDAGTYFTYEVFLFNLDEFSCEVIREN